MRFCFIKYHDPLRLKHVAVKITKNKVVLTVFYSLNNYKKERNHTIQSISAILPDYVKHFPKNTVGKSSRIHETEKVNTKLEIRSSTNVIKTKLCKLWIIFSLLGYIALGQLSVCTKQRE